MPLPEEALSELEQTKLKEIFDRIDADGDGIITPDDAKTVASEAGYELTDEKAEKIIGMLDPDGTGQITWDTFCTNAVKVGLKARIAFAIRQAFKQADTDGDRRVDAGEIRAALDEYGCGDNVSDDQINELITAVDATGDGKVSFLEFAKAMANRE